MSRWRHARRDQARALGAIAARRAGDPRGPQRPEVKLSIGASVHDPTDPVGRLLFNVLAMVAEFEADLIRLRIKEGMRVPGARAVCAESSPSSTRDRRRTWSRCTARASTACRSWRTLSASPARPCTARCSARHDDSALSAVRTRGCLGRGSPRGSARETACGRSHAPRLHAPGPRRRADPRPRSQLKAAALTGRADRHGGSPMRSPDKQRRPVRGRAGCTARGHRCPVARRPALAAAGRRAPAQT